MPQTVTAILVAYNSEKIIGPAIASLLADPLVTKITVVDNCSQDGICSTLRRDFPKVTLIENTRNAGFGPANNLALAKVDTDFALLVNPDAVVDAGTVERLLKTAADYPDAAIIAPALYNERGELHHSFKNNVFEREQPNSNRQKIAAEGPVCADFVSGAVMLFNMQHMRKVGFFDPDIFLYYEDDDICLRTRQAGYSIVYTPLAWALHLMGASSGAGQPEAERFKQKHMAWSRLYIEGKYQGYESAQQMALRLQQKYRLKLAFYRLQMHRMKIARYKGRLQGISEFLSREQTRQAA